MNYIEMNDILDFLLKQVGEQNLVQHIMTMSAPKMGDGMQRDIATFAFTWKALMEVHVPAEMDNMPLEVDEALWMVYREILRNIDALILEYGIEREPIGRLYSPRLKRAAEVKGRCDVDFRVYWQNFVLSSWSQNESFMMLIGCLTAMELRDLIKKFVLRLTPFTRFVLLKKTVFRSNAV